MGDNNESSSCESLLEGISNYFEDDDNNEPAEDFVNETDTELDIAINEELIKKSHEEIKKRMASLKTLIGGLKELVKNERELWRQEIGQVIATQNHYMMHALCYANSYCCPEWSNSFDYDFDKQKRICSASKSDEDLQLIKYHSELRTRRLSITNYHRNMAIENYKKKLLEVESMCNMELNRVKTSVQSLQTLQQLAAEWDLASGDNANKGFHHKSTQLIEKSVDIPLKIDNQTLR